MTAWADVDAWARLQNETLQRSRVKSEWRAFAFMNDRKVRWRGRPSDEGAELRIERACRHVPGAWRAFADVNVRALFLFRDGDQPTFTVVSRAPYHSQYAGTRLEFRRLQISQLLVVRDHWIDQGCPRRTHPFVVNT